jgi:uncharacterized peroxidase-related enzyme
MPNHDPNVSWFPLGDEAELAPELRELYAKCRDRLGFVPNVFQAFQWRPERLRAWLGHYDAVMEPTESLPAAEREMIAVTVSMLNGCAYCLVSHGWAVRRALNDGVLGDLVTFDHRRAPITERQHAILRYVETITRTPLQCSPAHLDELRGHGLSDEDLWDVAEIAALFNFTNRLALATGMVPNAEYHGMAR